MLHFEQRCERHNREFKRFLTYILILFCYNVPLNIMMCENKDFIIVTLCSQSQIDHVVMNALVVYRQVLDTIFRMSMYPMLNLRNTRLMTLKH